MERVLVVDDDRHVLTTVATHLRRAGYEVHTAADAEAAWELHREHLFPVVLSDLCLPTSNGIQLLTKIKEAAAGVSPDVLIMTGHSDLPSALAALRAGAFDYLVKPLERATLLATVARAAEHQRLLRQVQVFTSQVSDLTRQTEAYRAEFSRAQGLGQIILASTHLREVAEVALVLHRDRSIPVLIQGETGTGKEIMAKRVHFGDGSAVPRPFIDLNCAAIPATLFDTELFGYEAGAFTGASPGGQIGKIEMANGGTLFLDEIGDLPLEFQPKLLRALEERAIRRVGGSAKIAVDVRIICASNRDLRAMVAARTFRGDLYYRLNIGALDLKPLRQRREEIMPMALQFLERFAREKGKRFQRITAELRELLLAYPWPGNVRELRNAIERAVLLNDAEELQREHLSFLEGVGTSLPITLPTATIGSAAVVLPTAGLDLVAHENAIVREAMRLKGNNQSEAARFLHLTRSKLRSRLERLPPT
jgi:DNA-binding NtrC family response regulator